MAQVFYLALGGVIKNTTEAYFKQIDFIYLDKTIYSQYVLSKERLPGSADDCHDLLLVIELWYLYTCAETTRKQALKKLTDLYNVWNRIKTNLEIDPPTREKRKRLKNEDPDFKPDPIAKKMTTDQIIAEIDQQLRLWKILEIILKDDMIFEKNTYDEIASDLRNLLDETHTVKFYRDNLNKVLEMTEFTLKEIETFDELHWTNVQDYTKAIDTAIEKEWSAAVRKSKHVSLKGIDNINNAFGLSDHKKYWAPIQTNLMMRNPYFENYMCQY